MNDKIAILSDATLVFFSFEKKERNSKSVMTLAYKFLNTRMARMSCTFLHTCMFLYQCAVFHLYQYIQYVHVFPKCTVSACIYTFNAYEHYCIVWVLQQYFNSPCIKHWVSLKVFLTLFNQLQTSQTIRVECLSILPRKDMHSYCLGSLGKVLCEIL